VEYGDYECLYCGAAYPVLKDFQVQMGDRVRFVFRSFPITSSQPHAEKAVEAAEAAATQGHFWDMHDHLYQQELAGEHLHAHAQALGLNLKRFDQDLADNVYAPRVREDFMSGVRSGVNVRQLLSTLSTVCATMAHTISIHCSRRCAAHSWRRSSTGPADSSYVPVRRSRFVMIRCGRAG
jgi:Thioredoxin